MSQPTPPLFYISAAIAITGAVGYHFFIKKVPAGLNPFVNVLAIYLAVLLMTLPLLWIWGPSSGQWRSHFAQLNWLQVALGASVMMIEIGFLLMYRSGWDLSLGNVITGVFINLALVGLGLWLLRETLNWVQLMGVALSILGVALIGYKGSAG